MSLRTNILAFALLVHPVFVCAQESIAPASDTADNDLTREQWLARVEEARKRSQEFVEQGKAGRLPAYDVAAEETKIADDRAFDDPSLQRGDIVSTSKGFFMFIGGGDEQARDKSFVPLPEAVARTVQAR